MSTLSLKTRLKLGTDARIGIGMGVTLAVGEFTYIKPSVYIEVKLPNDVDIDEAVEELKSLVAEKLDELTNEMMDEWES